jgi:predicted alpha/beta superfamily hydrolase
MRRTLLAAFLALCAAFPAVAQTFTGAMSGSWWDASRPGEGQFITFEAVAGRNSVYLAYFTYTADGRATWHVGNVDYAPGAASITIPLITGSGPRFGTGFNSGDVRTSAAGTATLEYVSCTRMRLRHTGIEGVVLELTRLVGPLAGAGCGETPPAARSLTGVVSGSWWNSARGGEGQFITFEATGARNVVYVAYFTYTADGAATWLVGSADFVTGVRTVSVPLVTGSGARFGTAFRAQDVAVTAAGTATLDLTSCAALRLTYAGTQGFVLDLTRLVGPLNGLPCVDAPAATPLANETHFTTLASAHTGVTYPISMYFPPGYVPGSAHHPVVYAADSEFEFQTLVDTVRARGYNAIVVGVGNLGSDRRFVDYALPGAAAYLRFLTLELMPLIETSYRVDRTRRTFAGYSLSGSFAGIAMFLEDPANRRFSAYISVDGAFWQQTQQIYDLEAAHFATTNVLPVAIYLAAAENQPSITGFQQRLQARGYQGLRMRQQNYALNHSAVLPPGLVDGLAHVFAGN